MKLFNLFNKPSGSTDEILKKIYILIKNNENEQYFIYDTDKNIKTIQRLFKACKGLNYDFNSNTHLLGKVSSKGDISATIDGNTWYVIGSLRKSLSILPKDVLVLVTKPDKKYSYNKSGYNFYAKIYY